MVRTQIQLTDEQSALARKLAAQQKISLAALIRQGLDLLLRSRATVSQSERVRRAISAAGRFRSGAGDVARHHDRYLADAFRS